MGWDAAQHEDKGAKVAIIGPTGSFKTRTVLAAGNGSKGNPRLLVMDYEAGSDLYDDEFCFAREKIHQRIRLDDPEKKITEQEIRDLKNDRYTFQPILNKGEVYGVDFARVTMINRLAKKPIDFVLIDSVSMHHQWLLDKWMDIFYIRETKSQGHRGDYYTMQPRDYDKPYREIQQFILNLKALNVGVFLCAQEKPEYAEGQMMKKIGMTGDYHKRLPYLMDTVIHIEDEESGKAASAEKRHTKYIAITRKDRTNTLPARFVWIDNPKDGYCRTFVTLMENLLKWKGQSTTGLNGDNLPPAETSTPSAATATVSAPSETPTQTDELTFPLWPGEEYKTRMMKLKVLKHELQIPDDQWKAIIEKRGKDSARFLEAKQQEELITKLWEKIQLPQLNLMVIPAFEAIRRGDDPFRNGELVPAGAAAGAS